MTFTQGRTRCAVSIVPCTELPSTTMISWTARRTPAIAGSTTSRLPASLRVGPTTDTRVLPLRCIDLLPPTAVRRCLAHHAGYKPFPRVPPRGDSGPHRAYLRGRHARYVAYS